MPGHETSSFQGVSRALEQVEGINRRADNPHTGNTVACAELKDGVFEAEVILFLFPTAFESTHASHLLS